MPNDTTYTGKVQKIKPVNHYDPKDNSKKLLSFSIVQDHFKRNNPEENNSIWIYCSMFDGTVDKYQHLIANGKYVTVHGRSKHPFVSSTDSGDSRANMQLTVNKITVSTQVDLADE